LSIPKKSKNIKKKADKIISKKFCSCIKKVQQKFKKEGIAIGICTKSVITRKGYKRGKFRCKKQRTLKLQKGGRRKTRKKRGTGKRKYPEGSQDNSSSSAQTVALEKSAKRRRLAQVVITKWAELQDTWTDMNDNPSNYREEDFDMLDYEYSMIFGKVKELEENYRELLKKHTPGTPAYRNTISLVDENKDAMNIIARRRSILRLFIRFSVEADRQEGGKRRRKTRGKKRGGMENNRTKKSRNRLKAAVERMKEIQKNLNANSEVPSPSSELRNLRIPPHLNPSVSPVTTPTSNNNNNASTTPVTERQRVRISTSPITTMDNIIESMANAEIGPSVSGGKRRRRRRKKK